MDNNFSDLIGGVLSNPEMLNKMLTLMPIVSQMLNSDSANSANNSNSANSLSNSGNSSNKIAETTASPDERQPPPQANQEKTPENLLADENVMTALKNLILALNSANSASVASASPAPAAFPASPAQNNIPVTNVLNAAGLTSANLNNINNINTANEVNNTNGTVNQTNQANQTNQNNQANNIEKTLDTLKNISGATSPESDHRAKLLLALKPFLKEERKNKIDTAIKYINAAKIFNMFGKNGFV